MNLRVLHLVPSVGSRSGGLGPATLGLVQAQRDCGLDSRIWCLDNADGSAEAAASYGLASALTVWPMSPPATLGYSREMHHELISSAAPHFDIIHQHSMWLGLSHSTARAVQKFGCCTLIAPEGCLDAYALRISKLKKWVALRLYERRNLERARCMYALSDAEAASIRAFGLTNDIAVVPNGISADWLLAQGDPLRFRQNFSLGSERRIILYVGRLHPKKGLELLIGAATALQESLSDWVIVIGGDGEPSYRKSLMDLARENGVEGLVQFVGPLYGDAKRDAFASASLFVLPSYSEGAPMSVLEALAAGIPVITTYSSPWRELETNGCGWWVEAAQDAITQSVRTAVRKSPDELLTMGKKGRALVEEKYTWRKIAQQTSQLYQYLSNGAGRPDFVTVARPLGREFLDKKAA